MRSLKSVFTWLLALVPLAGGVTKSVEKSLPLFAGAAAPGGTPSAALPPGVPAPAPMPAAAAGPAPAAPDGR